jgi:hypothetical protein
MTETTCDILIAGTGRAAADLEPITTIADPALWERAAIELRERTYRTDGGLVRVQARWRRGRVELSVVDESGEADVAAFAELFCHEAFLLLNLAVPGACSGIVLSESVLDAKIFEFAWVHAKRHGTPRIEPLQLSEVIAWYDALQLGTAQVATARATRMLFTLLHLAQVDDDATAALWLAALPADAPVIHPMHDETLDPEVDAAALQIADAADRAAAQVIGELQEMVRHHASRR